MNNKIKFSKIIINLGITKKNKKKISKFVLLLMQSFKIRYM